MANGTEFNGSRHVLTRRITEEDILSHAIALGGAKEQDEPAEEPGSSVEELGETEMEVVENPRFATKSMTLLRKGTDGPAHSPGMAAGRDSGRTGRTGSEKPNRSRRFSLLGTHRDRDHDLHRQETSSTSETGSSHNRPSGGSRLFGSLRGIFSSHSGQHKLHKDKEGGEVSVSSFDHHVPAHAMVSTGKKGGKWTTRTDKNLKALKKGGSDDEMDPDNEEIERGRLTGAVAFAPPPVSSLFASSSHSPSPPASPTTEGLSTSTSSRRLKKARAGKPRNASVPPPSAAVPAAEAEVREGDGVVDLGEITDPDAAVRKEMEGERERGGSATPTVPASAPTQASRPSRPGPAPEASGSLSRSSSIVSAPTPGSKVPARGTGARAGRGRGGNGSGHRRAASISGMPSSISGSVTGPTTGTGAGRGRGSTHRNLVAPSPIYPHPLTLMNGVNGNSQSSASLPSPSRIAPSAASRGEADLNWERWAGAGAGLGEVIKAPPRVGRREIMNSYGGGGPDMGVASLGVGAGVAGTAVGGPVPAPSRAVVPGAPGVQMPLLKAPGSVFDAAAELGTVKEGMSSSVSAPAMLVPPALNGAGAKRPAKSPLRSALRNPSRTPSPLRPAAAHDEERLGRGGKPQRKETEEGDGAEEGDADTASISSYETGRETLFDTREERAVEPPVCAPVPPSKSLPNGVGLSNGNGNAHPHGTSENVQHRTASDVSTSTDQGQTVQRRKSVRVSLKPTYVGTLPSPVYDDDAGEAGAAGWGGGVGKERERDRGVPDMWEDSSEEDMEYAAARRMLAKAGAGAESKKKKERAR